MPGMKIKAGRYLIVDPSYLMAGPAWEVFLRQVQRFEAGLSLACVYNQPSLVWATRGDGTGRVLAGKREIGKVGVDSGMLALVAGEVVLDARTQHEIQSALAHRLVWFGMVAGGPVRLDGKGMTIGDIRVPHVG